MISTPWVSSLCLHGTLTTGTTLFPFSDQTICKERGRGKGKRPINENERERKRDRLILYYRSEAAFLNLERTPTFTPLSRTRNSCNLPHKSHTRLQNLRESLPGSLPLEARRSPSGNPRSSGQKPATKTSKVLQQLPCQLHHPRDLRKG